MITYDIDRKGRELGQRLEVVRHAIEDAENAEFDMDADAVLLHLTDVQTQINNLCREYAVFVAMLTEYREVNDPGAEQ